MTNDPWSDASIYREIQAAIGSIERNETLGEATNFVSRAEAIDFIEFHVIDRIDGMSHAGDLTKLKRRAESLKHRLETIDEALFREIRARVKSGHYTRQDLWRQLEGCAVPSEGQDDVGYDALDVFINGLLWLDVVPEETRQRTPEMVALQPTPARTILELIKRSKITQDDVFCDLGSGLGQVPILVNLLTGARAKGIELEPAYCDYARRCARELGLDDVEFVNSDARDADYADGTIFFMYTPFTGKLLQEVLEKLRGEARSRTIRIWAYGPCTLPVSNQSWLRQIDRNAGRPEHRLAMFESIEGMAG